MKDDLHVLVRDSFSRGENVPSVHWTGDQMDHRDSFDAQEKRKSLFLLRIELPFLASHFIN
jgi:hypothetical protein